MILESLAASEVAFNVTTSLESQLSDFASWMPVLIAVIIAVVILTMIVGTLSRFSDMGVSSSDDLDDEIQEKPKPQHKQTYLEYVKEMKQAQRIISK